MKRILQALHVSRFTLNVSGFTLIELMVVSGLMAVISLTTYSGLAGGVRIWKRVEASVQEVDLALVWKKLRKDFVAHIPYREIGYLGTPEEFYFPGLVLVKGEGGGTHKEVGRIRYLFQGPAHQLCREETKYTDLSKGADAACLPVLTKVDKVAFEYYGREEGSEGPGSWRPEWEGETPPLGVRLEIALQGVGGNSGIKRKHTATLP